MKMKVALISFYPVWEDKKNNMLKVEKHLQSIVHSDCNWVVFPEMTLTGFTMNIKNCAEDFSNSPSIRFFQEQAIQNKIYLSFGVILKCKDKASNNLITISPQGEIIASYAKIHPFSCVKEDAYYYGGNKLIWGKIADIQVGMSICYDLRFPEIFQALSKNCKIIVNIACWPEKRIQHWIKLLQARAIENQVFFIGVNRTGEDENKLNYCKSSMIINPEGEILNGKNVNNEIDIFEIDTVQVDNYRKSFPVKNDRKPELYKRML
jgi:predicted amidohydrolase